MTDFPIPPASLERLRVAYTQFEQLAAVVSEAMGVPPGPRSLNIQRGVFVVEQSAELAPEQVNGVAVG